MPCMLYADALTYPFVDSDTFTGAGEITIYRSPYGQLHWGSTQRWNMVYTNSCHFPTLWHDRKFHHGNVQGKLCHH